MESVSLIRESQVERNGGIGGKVNADHERYKHDGTDAEGE